MAMTARKKKGLGYMVGGLLFVVVGAILYFTASTPPIVAVIVQAIGAVGNIIGIAVMLPETT
jgi:hypothetical protein